MALGDRVIELLGKATDTAVLVAPFIRVDALRRLLESIPPDVQIRCVTRWRPEELAMGVSDLEVFTLLTETPGASLQICHPLHAKLFSADSTCLVGSANISRSALGWSRYPALELLVESTLDEPAVKVLLASIDASSTFATQVLYEEMLSVVESLPPTKGDQRFDGLDGPAAARPWLPHCKAPHDLFLIYQGAYSGTSQHAAADGLRDLEYLDLPTGLSEQHFGELVRLRLALPPVFSALSMGDPAVEERISKHPGFNEREFSGITEVRHICEAWLHHFWPR